MIRIASVLGIFLDKNRTIGLKMKKRIPASKMGTNKVDANKIIG